MPLTCDTSQYLTIHITNPYISQYLAIGRLKIILDVFYELKVHHMLYCVRQYTFVDRLIWLINKVSPCPKRMQLGRILLMTGLAQKMGKAGLFFIYRLFRFVCSLTDNFIWYTSTTAILGKIIIIAIKGKI